MKQVIVFLILGALFSGNTFGQNSKSEQVQTFNKLKTVLDTILQDDQQNRENVLELENRYGWESKEVQDLWKVISQKDSINLIKVEKILNEYGWLGPDQIGEEGNETLFLVIQHANIETQDKYLPMLEEAVKNGNAKAGDYALLKDRVLLRHGEKQIYGSQLEIDSRTQKYVLSPMIDPDNVDRRRESVGLMPLAEYLKYFDLEWDVEKFKKRMAEYDLERIKE